MTIFEPGDGEPITRRRSEMGEKMTLEQVREKLRYEQDCAEDEKSHAYWRDMADAIDAHLATPAQTVDVEAVREVISTLERIGEWECSDKLSRAIGDKT
jgi:hypothetical protein